jgi:pimeloyl-ACP methyl ester carboxylesterase
MNARAIRIASAHLLAIALFGAERSPAQTTPTPPGKLVDLGGHRLHVNCTGKGAFTVVVENGLGDFSFDWILVQQGVEKFTRICTYDRAGYAWSDPGPKPRTYAQLNLELHDALDKLHEHRPLILVGHSFGGGVVRNYATTYPSEVAAMVLVDIVQEDQRISMGPNKTGLVRDSAKGLPIPEPRENLLPSDKPNLPTTTQTPGKIDPPYDRLPQKEQHLHAWAEQLPAINDAEDSQKEWSAEYMQQLHEKPQEGSLGAIPLIVLTRTQGGFTHDIDLPAAQLEANRLHAQSRLALLSSNGKQIMVNSGHAMHLEAPDTVTDAIRSVRLAANRSPTTPKLYQHAPKKHAPSNKPVSPQTPLPITEK